jgi:hypothetical protein
MQARSRAQKGLLNRQRSAFADPGAKRRGAYVKRNAPTQVAAPAAATPPRHQIGLSPFRACPAGPSCVLISFMSTDVPPPVPPAERLARLIDGLCAAIAARGIGGLLTAPLIFLLWGRLRRAALRARQLAEKIAAGQPLSGRRRNPAPPRSGRPPPPRLPRGYAWLIRLVPATASGASQLRALLTDPEMAALVQAAPMRRLVRPLCQMLGVAPPPVPKRQAVAPAPAAPAAHATPRPATGPSATPAWPSPPLTSPLPA